MMKRAVSFSLLLFLVAGCLTEASSQQALTWSDVRERFVVGNPTLQAGRIGIDESRAQEITAYLRPNPTLTVSVDQLHPWRTYEGYVDTLPIASVSQLFERRHKRQLRRESAEEGTKIAISQLSDQERGLLFTLRSAFVEVLQQKAMVELAKADLDFYDHVLQISGDRYKAGDIARIDLDRLQLQRVTYESDLATAEESLKTSKIQLLMLLNDRTPIEQFDVAGPFDFSEQLSPLGDFRKIALETRPDLKAAVQSIDQARVNYQLAEANASTDPTIGIDVGRSTELAIPTNAMYMGLSVSIPVRIFDRNQGERIRTKLDIKKNERLRDAAEAQVFNDVDTAYVMIEANVVLLRPYKEKYLEQAVRIRDTVTFSYQRGGASLLDFLQAQSDYRSVQRNYLTLVGSYLSATAQLNQAVGKEVMQ